MSKNSNIFSQLAQEALNFLSPLREIESAEELLFLLEEAGIAVSWPFFDTTLGEFTGNLPQEGIDEFDKIKEEINDLIDLLENFTDGELGIPEITSLIERLPNLFGIIENIKKINFGSTIPDTDEILKKIPTYLLVAYTRDYQPTLFSTALMLGVFDLDENGNYFIINKGTIKDLLSNPIGILKNQLWQEDDVAIYFFLYLIRYFASGLGLLVNFEIPTPEVAYSIGEIPEPPVSMEDAEVRALEEQLNIVLFSGFENDSFWETGINILPIPKEPNNDANFENIPFKGFAILPYGIASKTEQIALGDQFLLKLFFDFEAPSEGFGISVTTDGVHLKNLTGDILSDSGFKIEGRLTQKKENKKQYAITDQMILNLGALELGFGMEAEGTDLDFFLEFLLRGAGISSTSNDADNFIQKLIPGGGLQSNFDIGFGISSSDGFYVIGSGGLEITIPLNKTLGPLYIESLYLAFLLSGKELPIKAGLTFSASLGPVLATVHRIGIKVPIRIGDGNLKVLNIGTPAFLPPLGAGLAINAGPVIGGGYVEFDDENKRYAGILELKFMEIGLVAIGLVTTRMPDGSKGFSMLVIIGVTFTPAIQLGYGFTLSGVGGLLGVNRTMDIAFLQEGLKNGTLDSVLFPEEPIKNATRIISDLRNAFPPAKGRFIIGPMAIIGWGTPTIIQAELAILIELPLPLRIALLGQIVAKLPEANVEQETLIEFHLDFIGVLDFAKKELSFFASIYDSRILKFSLTGDMAMKLTWGENPVTVMSFGGYNPRFNVPPGFPSLRRLALSMGEGGNPSFNLQCYFALTPNTLQFGSQLEVYASKGSFRLHALLAFDTLIYFNPFSFIIDISAQAEISKGSKKLLSVNVAVMLSGPTPWHAKGKASFKVLFVKVKIRFDIKWGKSKKATLPPVDPWESLKLALEEPDNWYGELMAVNQSLVRFRSNMNTNSLEEEEEATIKEKAIYVAPDGSIVFRQKVLPFDFRMTKFGNSPIIGGERKYKLKILGKQSDGTEKELSFDYVQDYMAEGQFRSIADPISQKPFAQLNNGVRITSNDLEAGSSKTLDLQYENETIDSNRVSIPGRKNASYWRLAKGWMKSSARENQRSGGNPFYSSGKSPQVEIQDDGFAIVQADDLQSPDGLRTKNMTTYSQAKDTLEEFLAQNPEWEERLQIVHKHELP